MAECPTCQTCGKTFKHIYSLNAHILRHGPKTHQCPVCDKAFYRRDELIRHEASSHEKKKTNICDICGDSFAVRDGLLRHRKSEHEGATYTCGTCHKIFAYKSSCKKHEKSHMENEECPSCHKLFKASYIAEHKRVCSNPFRQRHHQCDQCNKTFLEKKYLKEHIKYKHGPERYTCEKCGAPFAHRKSKMEHTVKCSK